MSAGEEAPDAITAREMFDHVLAFSERIARIEARAGRIAWGWQAWAVVVPVLLAMFTCVALIARIDARQQEESQMLRATMARLDAHVELPGHPIEVYRLETLRESVHALEERGR